MEKVQPYNLGKWLAWVCGLCCTFCSWLSVPALAAELPRIDISQLHHEWLKGQAEYLQTGVRVPFDDVRQADFQPLSQKDVNQGISGQAHWVRFRVVNSSSNAKSWVIHNDTSYLDNLVVYYRSSDSSSFARRHLSDREPFGSRDLDYRSLAFRHTTPPNAHTDVYLKLYFDKADSMSLNLHLWDEDAFWQQAREENLVYGGYYGVLFILVILSLTFAILLRQSNALFYAVFLLVTATMWLLLNGYAFQYLWPNSVFWHNEGFHIFYLLFVIFALQFSKTFLRTRHLQPLTHRAFNCVQLVALAGLGWRAAGNYAGVLDLAFALLVLIAVVIPWASWRAFRAGMSYARWYTLSWLVYSISLIASVVSAYTGALQWGMGVLDYMQAGSLLEAVFLMVAMSEWLLSLDSDRRKALALANQDPLTGLGNRRLLQMQYEKFRAQFIKDEQPVFLIMLDLDHFKQVNDTYGHEAGDHVLKAVAELIQRLSREDDVCIRYGGEEFAILMRADHMDDAWRLAERIRTQFAKHPTIYNDIAIEHTLSSGITAVLSDSELLNEQEMMSRADAALYAGKSAGRNQSVVHETDSTDTLTTNE